MEPSEVLRLERERKLLWMRALEASEFLRGSLVLMKRKCVHAGCRKCASGERHPTWVLTYNEGGKTHTVYVGDARREEAARLVESYRRLQALIEEVAQVNLRLFRAKRSRKKGAGDGKGGQGP
jgi:hypothetical protein